MKSTPNLPASSVMKMPTGGGPSIKNPIKVKALSMTGGVASKGKITGAGKGATKKLVKKGY